MLPIGARVKATQNFDQARQQARRQQWLSWLSGDQRESLLIPFDEIWRQLHLQNPHYVGIQQVPLAQIVGSVGRYQDFTREFLPLNDEMRDRWVRVEQVAYEQGWPPVDLYQVGEVYFVRDGNHRVAIARQMKNDTIEANVLRYPEMVDITTADSLNQILLKLGEHNFLTQTKLPELYPDQGIAFTVAGRYSYLLAQIHQVRQNLATIDRDDPCAPEEISFNEAVCFWYEAIYLPAIEIIRDAAVMSLFPERTEADLYVWLFRYRHELQQRYGETYLGNLLARAVKEHQPSRFNQTINRFLALLGLEPDGYPFDLDAPPDTTS